jgi:hypothetical protein
MYDVYIWTHPVGRPNACAQCLTYKTKENYKTESNNDTVAAVLQRCCNTLEVGEIRQTCLMVGFIFYFSFSLSLSLSFSFVPSANGSVQQYCGRQNVNLA